jgi:DUF2934 family protein
MDIDNVSPAFIIVSADDIAKRAYGFYLERGCAPGYDREDWLRAEHELKDPRANATRMARPRSQKR